MERPADFPRLTDYKPSRFMLPTSHYDEAKADRAVRFIEMLPHTKGEWEGKPSNTAGMYHSNMAEFQALKLLASRVINNNNF